jgi:response regulator of citrate/malate metabolism
VAFKWRKTRKGIKRNMVANKIRDLALKRLKLFLEANQGVAFSALQLAPVAQVSDGTARHYLQHLAGNGFLKSSVLESGTNKPKTVVYKWKTQDD